MGGTCHVCHLCHFTDLKVIKFLEIPYKALYISLLKSCLNTYLCHFNYLEGTYLLT